MIRLSSIPVPLSTSEKAYAQIAAKLLSIPTGRIRSCRLSRRAVDARRKDDVHFAISLDVEVDGESAVLAHCHYPHATILKEPEAPALARATFAKRPVVVGSGPAGLFASLWLAKAGANPVLLERGCKIEERQRDVSLFFKQGVLNPNSNVQFGEGGAGTFSDGKLNTGTKDPRHRAVLQTFARLGAPEEILFQAKPHIGTDRLAHVIANLREEIIALGGTVLFETRLDGLLIENGSLRGMIAHREDVRIEIEADALVLAIGHSARDTFEMLHQSGVPMIRKPFSIGVRIEHAQSMINRAQYGRFHAHPALGAAEYKLSAHLPNGRGVYTFCMCPGGVVVAAASEPNMVATNGMSAFARDGENANSAILVDVRPDDIQGESPLGGFSFQRHWERAAFAAGGGNYFAPAQNVTDFLEKRASKRLLGAPTYQPGVTPADLRECLPGFVVESITEALPLFQRQLHGFIHPDALLTGVETRSSCPVRIPRDPAGQCIPGIFPAGEGAGYAGGILSAAVDGMRAAERVLEAQAGGGNQGTLLSFQDRNRAPPVADEARWRSILVQSDGHGSAQRDNIKIQ